VSPESGGGVGAKTAGRMTAGFRESGTDFSTPTGTREVLW
jgi:hypothetical protein